MQNGWLPLLHVILFVFQCKLKIINVAGGMINSAMCKQTQSDSPFLKFTGISGSHKRRPLNLLVCFVFFLPYIFYHFFKGQRTGKEIKPGETGFCKHKCVTQAYELHICRLNWVLGMIHIMIKRSRKEGERWEINFKGL